ncbi:serine protease inhibitor Cvsi-2-like isoform X2 [Pecten maximus]|uniref:serine protease inhibitor Cvsi-2-like isoform X2 n=1 Tax=Pecten maximus TaxID=6579 RepID=UPI00145851BA|nr:serine protease inhibitor Cvsi-2-like isoform X2 [Pecten maximus]
MRFYIVTACLAAFLAYVVSERCHEDDDVSITCVLTECSGNHTMMICEHNECTCAIDPRVPCNMKADCENDLGVCGHEHHGPHHGPHDDKRAPHDDDKAWHCLDNFCKCF